MLTKVVPNRFNENSYKSNIELYEQGYVLLALSPTPLQSSKVDTNRTFYKLLRPCKFFIKHSCLQGAVLSSGNAASASCKEQEQQRWHLLFEIQKQVLKLEGPQQQEALWKK